MMCVMLLLTVVGATDADNATRCAVQSWSGQLHAKPVSYQSYLFGCASVDSVANFGVSVCTLLTQMFTAAPVLALVLVKHHAGTAAVAVILAVVHSSWRVRAQAKLCQLCLQVAYGALALALTTVEWAASSPVQAVESAGVLGSVLASLVHNYYHAAHTCARCGLVLVANCLNFAASPMTVAGMILSYLLVSTLTTMVLQLCWSAVTTVRFSLPSVISRVRRDGLFLGCMGTARWVRVPRGSQHPRATEHVRVSSRHSMIKTVKLRIRLDASPNASLGNRMWNLLCSVCLGSRFMAENCAVEYANCFVCSANYNDIEQ